MPLLDPQLKALLVCPACHGELDEDEAAAQLCCRDCKRTYPVREFPVMLLDDSSENDASAANG